MKTILVLILAFPFFGGAAGEHCPGVPALAMEPACREACGTRLMYDMCMDTLGDKFGTSRPVEVTAYALLAAQSAMESYAATVDLAYRLLSGPLDGDERAAYQVCFEAYGDADLSMRRVADDMLPGCSFAELAAEYMDGLMSLEKCRDRLIRLGASPLDDMNLVDRNKELLAYTLAKLLGI